MSSSRFECIRVAFRQDKDGYVMTIRIHPNDMDGQIMLDPVGQRYYCTLMRVDEDERPIKRKERGPGEIMVQQAGILCKDPEFQKWMQRQGYALDDTEESVVKGLRDLLTVESRSELASNAEAQEIFRELLKAYGR